MGEKLSVYPWLHPLARKSQLTPKAWMDLDIEIFDILLNEGEILYIPSMWFHEVESVNHPKAQYQKYLFALPVFDNVNLDTPIKSAFAIKYFFTSLFREFGWNENGKIIRQFVESSYDPLYAQKGFIDSDKVNKYDRKMKKICKIIKKIEAGKHMSDKHSDVIDWYNQQIKNGQIEMYSKVIHEWMMKNEGDHTRMMLMSYIEITTHKLLPVDSIYFF